jgi:5-methylcytosine-specific restriction protein B
VAPQPVEAVWVWRFTKTPFKAIYGRLKGSTYTKDFLQPIGPCAKALDEVFHRDPGQEVPLTFRWPGGSREGKYFEAADYAENGRLDLRWQTNEPPDPWRLYPDDIDHPLKTLPGDPSHTVEEDANAEWEALDARSLDAWLVVVKLYGEQDALHLRAHLGNPPDGLEHTTTARLPSVVRSAMASVPAGGGCAVVRVEPGAAARAPKIVSQMLEALSRGPNVLLVGPPGTGKTVALEDLRELFEKGASSLLFDPDILHNSWFELPHVPTGMVRTIVLHPSYSYEEFVIGLYPVPAKGTGVDLKPRPGPLLSLGHWAEDGANALLLIDEFNRGNAAAIFGDTLALLDKEKRRDPASGQVGATIDRPYADLPVDVAPEFANSSGTSLQQELHLPLSLWIVTAMNSSDRSVAPLDAALRRRFSIVRVEPDYDVLATRLGVAPITTFPAADDPSTWSPEDVSRLAVAVLRRLNDRIELVLGADFLLGHALLWDVGGADTQSAVASLCAAFDERVASTLRMTFADQDEPLAAILGAGPPPAAGSPPSGSLMARWVVPPSALEAVAPPRLRITLTQQLGWLDAAKAFRALL